jgi:hypothetical protein
MDIKKKLRTIKTDNLTNNTQKAAWRLLSAQGKWLSQPDLARTVKSASARVRDLRKAQFGSFRVDCKRASELKKRGDSFFYRINPNNVTQRQLDTVFRTS